ncbi:nicotinate-nucleotide adenylyltransferase [Marinobacter daepoensis]|uniref:Probable nicotinate-nucleotide adenylyltransferase n=1 Tax=Marinobacter daepoensis TaxID=262077 RepID=A0ABS3BI99_9GAMM|nr:nicotinate-nucleotide adenylyltransferase [Marinobacter daepoensis]MBN7771556.1 nicotinate-nucleotide adenylyltransferase [Marinobacter daepoensis]MBY6080156.1 nicotinate-nucleotide adenylyltransferase [Marinobacter daepoensis]
MHVIYGGTFDPIHHGHLRLALEVSEALSVSRVHLVPSHIPPHKGVTGASSEQRLEMIRQAIAGDSVLTLDDREVRRAGASYTAETLRQLRAELGPERPLVMVVGTDAFSSFDLWREWQAIPGLAHIVVVRRPGADLPVGSEAARLMAARRTESVSDLQVQPSGRVLELEPPLLDISATGIRQRVAEGRSTRYLTPDTVCQYIEAGGLYGARSARE